MKKWTAVCLFLFLAGRVAAQEAPMVLSLDSCRALALRNNKELRMATEKQRSAEWEHKAALTKYFPRVSATGAYMHTSKELSLLSDEQKGALNHLGSAVGSLAPEREGLAGTLNGVGAGLVEALHTDTRNMGTAAVMLTQPVYMGGKIVAYNRITRYAEQIAKQQQDLTLQELVVQVDEAYWQIVALQSRKQLAEGYMELVRKLDSDVQQLISEGFATRADGLSVKVKVNEAQVALIQVDNGIALSKMLLCQLCGLDLDLPVMPADAQTGVVERPETSVAEDMQTAFTLRPELNALSLSADIYKEKVRLARAEFMPTVALTGGWMGSNPSVFNSFERKFKGVWNVGVVVNIPLVTWGERNYKVRVARAQESMARYHWEETREKVELQVTQCRQKVEEAAERLQTALRSQEEADENLRYATLGMQEGVVPVSNVLEAQTAWLAAHSACVTAQIDLRLADLYLNKALGRRPVMGS
ncbi:MAG: TolC family protein [Alloprevotella sp.]